MPGPRRCRWCPPSTGAAKAVGDVIPDLKGKLDGLSVRVPTPNVSMVDFNAMVKKPTTPEEVNEAFHQAAGGELQGILQVVPCPWFPATTMAAPISASVDAGLTAVMQGNMVKVMAWYDNEMGFSNRMINLAAFMGQRLGA